MYVMSHHLDGAHWLCCQFVCLSVWPPEDTLVGCNHHNLGTARVRTDLWGAKLTCGVQLVNTHADIASMGGSVHHWLALCTTNLRCAKSTCGLHPTSYLVDQWPALCITEVYCAWWCTMQLGWYVWLVRATLYTTIMVQSSGICLLQITCVSLKVAALPTSSWIFNVMQHSFKYQPFVVPFQIF